MALETALTFAMMGLVVFGFLVLHTILRTFPFTQAVPRERYRWPVWNWYALVVVFGFGVAFAANLYWNERIPRVVHANEIEPAWTYDARSPVNDPDPHGVIQDSEIQRVSGKEQSQAPTPTTQGTGDAPAVVPATGDSPAWAATPVDPGASPTGVPIASPPPFKSPTPTPSGGPTPSATPSPSPSPSPSPR